MAHKADLLASGVVDVIHLSLGVLVEIHVGEVPELLLHHIICGVLLTVVVSTRVGEVDIISLVSKIKEEWLLLWSSHEVRSDPIGWGLAKFWLDEDWALARGMIHLELSLSKDTHHGESVAILSGDLNWLPFVVVDAHG